MSDAPSAARAALVTDFDGTLTDRDVYELVLEHFGPPPGEHPFEAYRAGRLTHLEAMQRIFAQADDEQALVDLLPHVGLQPGLRDLVDRLDEAGWDVVVVSAGCQWYIDRLLAGAGVEVTIHSNPGRFEPGRGLVIERPTGAFVSEEVGIDKAAVLRHVGSTHDPVAFSGDGLADLPPARLVPDRLRFARGDLAAAAAAEGLPTRSFGSWAEVVEQVLAT
ncbi:MAG: HAD-IB family phosphatase [Nitriliruptoraceae bacterium]